MGLISRLLERLSPAGLRLDEPDAWDVTGTGDVERFLRAICLLAPPGSFAYFEGTAEPHVAEYLRGVSVAAPVHVAVGTIWPRPDTYHVPVTAEAMEAMAAFLERNPAGFFCAHCHLHDGVSVLLQWYDAFGANPDPMQVSRRVGEEAVRAFSAALGSSYAPGDAG